MLQFPHPVSSPEIDELTHQILTLAAILRDIPLPQPAVSHIFHRQFLKSSLFSARIEGNTLTLLETTQTDITHSQEKSKKEVANILQVLQQLEKWQPPLEKEKLQELHRTIMNGIDAQAGKLRNGSSAIFDQFGNVVYLTPSPQDMHDMLTTFFQSYNLPVAEHESLTHLCACHYYFEKIHPFIDGNGRTGRVLLHAQLQKTNLFGEYMLPIDEYFEKYRSDYYFYLEKNSRDVKSFAVFFLKGILWSLHSILNDIKEINHKTPPEKKSLQELLPRRQEICAIIQDHPYISMDMLYRRFPTIPHRTLAYDVQWLVAKKFLIKHGTTRGVRYSGEPLALLKSATDATYA